jgi:hypothetical protein
MPDLLQRLDGTARKVATMQNQIGRLLRKPKTF